MPCKGKEFVGLVAACPKGESTFHVTMYRIEKNVAKAIRNAKECGFSTSAVTVEEIPDETHIYLVARVRST